MRLTRLALAVLLAGCSLVLDFGDEIPAPDAGSADAVNDAGTPDARSADARPDAASVCGDGELSPPEVCDDGNGLPGDGCAWDCSLIEPDFICPIPGDACVRIVTCGNAKIEGDETCDDGDALPGDGCSAVCEVEAGWTCPVVGSACVAIGCGDGYLAGFEACDDGDTDPGDGCDAACRLEEGYVCPTPGLPCAPTVCGDMVVEGTEECEDGNLAVGDGCTPFCKREPVCADGVCSAVCGDAVVWAPEECDDGNTVSGDGCSATCLEEPGFGCVEVPEAPPAAVDLPVTYRDFIAWCGVGARLADFDVGAVPPYGHPDFECYSGALTGMVAADLSADGKPVRVNNARTYSDASFDLWYRSNPDYNLTSTGFLTLPAIGGGAYQFSDTTYFPLDGAGFVAAGTEQSHTDGDGTPGRNFHFTSEVHTWFTYAGTEVLTFTGDDDVWVFINGHLAVDIGGVHGATSGSVTLSAVAATLGLTVGGIYEAVVFQAERHTTRSNYTLTLTNFTRAPSVCTSDCGDGVRSSIEACDDGTNDGSYGGCNPDCTFAPYCGDGDVQTALGEVCDDGLNLGGGVTACAPGCQSWGPVCGDGVLQIDNDEECDDGNTVPGDGCDADCHYEIG